MNRETRLRRVIPGAPADLISALAAWPAAEVDMVVAAARQARRDERAHQADLRRQRKADARRHHHYDEEQLAARNLRLLDAAGRRAREDLDALRWLAESRGHHEQLLRIAVAGLRAQGLSDGVIGDALGVTRQAVGQYYGRKAEFTSGGDGQ